MFHKNYAHWNAGGVGSQEMTFIGILKIGTLRPRENNFQFTDTHPDCLYFKIITTTFLFKLVGIKETHYAMFQWINFKITRNVNSYKPSNRVLSKQNFSAIFH